MEIASMPRSLLLFTGVVAILLVQPSHGYKFSEENFVVFFSPNVSRNDLGADLYDESELVSMIAKIATKFRRILIPSINGRNYSVAKVPKAVAQYNTDQQHKAERPLELLMLYDVLTSSSTNFSYHKGLADEANRVFPGTVKILIGDIRHVNADRTQASMAKEMEQAKTMLINASSTGEYKLGVFENPIHFCNPDRPDYWEEFEKLFASTVDLVVLDYQPVEEDVKFGFEFAETLPSQFTNCATYIKTKSKEVKVAFQTFWPDTIFGKRNLGHLNTFWKRMNDWAGKANVTVVLKGAFDSPTYSDINRPFDPPNHVAKFQLTTGWWRLVESSAYRSALDYIFEEKINGAIYNQQSNSSVWLPTYFPKDKELNFNVTNFGVSFSPYVSNHEVINWRNCYEKDDLLPFLKQVSAEFRKILVQIPAGEEIDYISCNAKIPSAMAELKYENLLPQLFEVVLVLTCQEECEPQQGYQHFDLSKFVHTLSPMGWVVIIPDTVTTLLIQYDTAEPWRKILTDLETTKRLANERIYYGAQLLRFGIVVERDPNEDERLQFSPSWSHLLNQTLVSVVILRIVPTPEDLQLEVEQSLGGYFRRMRFFQEKIQRVNKEVEVGFTLEWPDTNASGDHNIGKLVEFWGKVRAWAEESNTTVFMSEAFDAPFRKPPMLNKRGWWRLSESSPNHSLDTSAYKFIDKKSIFLEELKNLENEKQNGTRSDGGSSNKVEIIIAAVVAGVSVVGFASVAIYTRFVKKKSPYLTKAEIDEFFNGGDGATQLLLFSDGEQHTTAYNKDLECASEDFSVDEESILGSGEFGIVFQAKLQKEGVELNVAAKTTKPPTSALALKGIMSEIRILGYLGKSENIVSIVGAYTAELCQGIVFVFMELCQLGSLNSYLRKIRLNYVKVVIPLEINVMDVDLDEVGYVIEQMNFEDSDEYDNDSCDVVPLTSSQVAYMLKWSREICSGMEFLASKHVVHADLATRNVLLTQDKTAKITDFGLSRRLYAYQSYIKEQKEALPWRWMSPESLRNLEFNEKTDIWSYGVTLWEIFSLVEVPYAGITWGTDFVRKLEDGMRLQKPRYCDEILYTLMLKCWELDRNQRPTSSEIQTLFEQII